MKGTTIAGVVVACFLGTGCLPELRSPFGAQLACANDDACPADLVCLADGHCERRDGPCLESDREGTSPIEDGAPCVLASGAGLCVAGRCAPSSCGDGMLDVRLAEQCDDGEANADAAAATCSSSCHLPFCGDGFVNAAESCEGPLPNATCASCALLCDESFGDCNARAADGCECAPELTLGSSFNEPAIPFPTAVEEAGYFMFRPELLADGPDLWLAEAGFVFKVAPNDTTVQFIINPNGSIPDSGDFYTTPDVVQDDTYFFWVMNDRVARLKKVGGVAAVFVAQGVGATTLVSLAVDDEFIYFTSQFTIFSIEKETQVAFRGLAVMGSFESSIAVDDDGVYFSSLDDGKVGRADKPGVLEGAPPPPTFLAEDEIDPRGTIVNDGFVYWGTGDGAIRRVATSGGPVEQVAKVDQTADNLVMKDGSLFWTAIGTFDGKGIVYRLRLDEPGAQPAPAMRLDDEVENLAVGDDFIWANPATTVFAAPVGD